MFKTSIDMFKTSSKQTQKLKSKVKIANTKYDMILNLNSILTTEQYSGKKQKLNKTKNKKKYDF